MTDRATESVAVTQRDRAWYCGCTVTLDGERAIVSGVLMPYAMVSTLGHSTRATAFSWEAVARIMREQDGAFTS